MKHIKTFEDIKMNRYNVDDYIYVVINKIFIYYGKILSIDDSDKNLIYYSAESLDEVSGDYIPALWFSEASMERLMTDDEINYFNEKVELLKNAKKYNL